jgi:uncharacterized protein YcfJ
MKFLIASAILSLVVSPLTQAKHHNNYQNAGKHSHHVIKARVIDSTPVYKYLTVEQTPTYCEPRVVRKMTHRSSDKGAAIVGGIIGGFVGHTASHEKHKGFGTVMGAVIGSSLGHNIGVYNHRNYKVKSQNCVARYNTPRKIRVLDGYNVTYRSKGKIYRSFTQDKPGRYIRIY